MSKINQTPTALSNQKNSTEDKGIVYASTTMSLKPPEQPLLLAIHECFPPEVLAKLSEEQRYHRFAELPILIERMKTEPRNITRSDEVAYIRKRQRQNRPTKELPHILVKMMFEHAQQRQAVGDESIFARMLGLRHGGDINKLPEHLVGPLPSFNDPRSWWHGYADHVAFIVQLVFRAADKTVSFKYESKALNAVKALLDLGGISVTKTALRRHLGH